MFNWIVPRNRNYNNCVAKCQHYRASWSCGLNVWIWNWTELRSYSERVQEDLNLAWCMMNFSEHRWKLNAVCLRHSPTGQQGPGALLAGGWVAREACATHPPTSREPTPVRGVALVLGGQNPITLEYQIYPPPIDTLVTGMGRGGGASRLPCYVFYICPLTYKDPHANKLSWAIN